MKKISNYVLYGDNESIELREVKGYYTFIKEIKVFIYRGTFRWQVIDLETGLSFSSGDTYVEAKNNAEQGLVKLKRLRDTNPRTYAKYKTRYRDLLKELPKDENS